MKSFKTFMAESVEERHDIPLKNGEVLNLRIRNPRHGRYIFKGEISGNRAIHGTLKHDDMTNKASVEDVDTSVEHRRKGVATAVYDHFENHHKFDVVPSDTLQPDGRAFWRNRNPLKY